MEPRTLGDYGGPYADSKPVENPETQVAADYYNRKAEDTAQLTRTTPRAIVKFTAMSGSGDVPSNQVFHKSLWGSGDAQKPTVAKVSAGRYTITYSATFQDGLSATETVSFFAADARAMTGDPLDVLTSQVIACSSNVAEVEFYSSGTAADDGSNSTDMLTCMVFLY